LDLKNAPAKTFTQYLVIHQTAGFELRLQDFSNDSAISCPVQARRQGQL